MARRLSAEEQALWRKVVDSVRPLRPHAPAPAPVPAVAAPTKASFDAARPRRSPSPPPSPPPPRPQPGVTLDGSWDKRISRGIVQPDATIDLHGHNLATAHALLDRRIEEALAQGARVLLLVTGKPPTSDRRPVARGAIRAAIHDWLSASRHAADIAAVRNAHPRHGGAGALYLILRKRRQR